VTRVVINTAWLGAQFEPALGDGSRWGLRITYSHEGLDHGGALETAGGIAKALPHLGACFWVVSGDVFVPGFNFDAHDAARFVADVADPQRRAMAKLWLAPNAAHHEGDFGIDPHTGLALSGADAQRAGVPKRTWASLGLFSAAMFQGVPVGTKMALRPLLDSAVAQGQLQAQAWDGGWTDVGTLARWQSLGTDAHPASPAGAMLSP
jgi:N-acetyl-alpha-D-muramate 1-phosphate uridylyltransferase